MSLEGGTGQALSCPRLDELPRARGRGFPWSEETPPAVGAHPPSYEEPPLITVVTPCLDQGRFLEGAIRSVLLQGYPRLEYILLDGGSTDGTIDVVRRYERWITWWRSAPDRGQAAAINEGVGRASGELVGWLNSDDRLLAGALRAFAAAAAGDPGAVGYCGTGFGVDERGRLEFRMEPKGLTRDELAWGPPNVIHQAACLVRRDAFLRAGGVDEDLACSFDFKLWLDLADKGRFSRVDAELAEAVVHRDAKTQRWADLMIAERAVILMQLGYEAEAVRWIRLSMRPYLRLESIARRVFANPLYRLARPFLRALGVVGGKTGEET